MSTHDQSEYDPLLGTTFADRYLLTARLGKGGMAVVYRATDRNLGRDVAIKVLRKDIATDPTAAKRLVREARAAAALHHPHIITIHDVGEHDGTVYVVMEILTGKSLADELEQNGSVGVTRALTIAEQVASALVVAHGQGIVHRDLKPENLYLLDRGGDADFVKMLDFSIAKLPTEMVTAALTRAGSVFGTPHYMAPEQVEGKVVGPTADLYALGAVLYELVDGEPPYDGASVIDILLKHVKGPIPSLAQGGRALPDGLDALVTQLLAKKAADRPQTATEVRDRLTQLRAAWLSSALAQRSTAAPPAAVVEVATAEHGDARPFDRTVDADPAGSRAVAVAADSVEPPAAPATAVSTATTVPPPPPADLPEAVPRRTFAGFGGADDDGRTLVGVGVGRALDQLSRARPVAPALAVPPPPVTPPAPVPAAAVQAPGAVEGPALAAPVRAPSAVHLASPTAAAANRLAGTTAPPPPRPAAALAGGTRRPPPPRPVPPPPPASAAPESNQTVELSQVAAAVAAPLPATVVERAPAQAAGKLVWVAVAAVAIVAIAVVLWLALR